MAKIIEQIKQPISEEMDFFEGKFRLSMSSPVALLNRITHYIVNRKGKQMRPMFVFLVAKMIGKGQVNERTYRGASVIELIHTATLVHDDVVDDSNKRRGFFSNNDFDLLKIISVAVREMSEGELLQIEKARRLDITEEVYYEIIRQKTATLIAACCAMGACSVAPQNSEIIEKMRLFGEYVGMAFQIKDDLFDYTEDAIGKPTGIDIKEQKMTLPLIYVLNTSSEKDKNWLINSVKKYNKDKKRVKEVIAFVKENQGLKYAEQKMMEYQQKALDILNEFPDSPYKKSLLQIVDYVISRNI